MKAWMEARMIPSGFVPKIRLRFERGDFVVKTLEHDEELYQALRLRHAVFHEEHHGRVLPSGMDVDEVDFRCDHLAVVDRATDRVIGSYRLVSTLFADSFYANARFDL